MKAYNKRKASKITFKTHRKHRSKEGMNKEQRALSIFSRRYFT